MCAVIAFSASQNNDKIGVIFFSDKIEKFIPPKKGKSHILRIIRELINIEPTNKGTNIELALKYLNTIFDHPGMEGNLPSILQQVFFVKNQTRVSPFINFIIKNMKNFNSIKLTKIYH